MGKILAAFVVFVPMVTSAQSVSRVRSSAEFTILTGQINGAAPAGATPYAMAKTPSDRGVTIVAAGALTYGNSGGGAGTTIVRVSDGTNNCDATIACTATQTSGAKEGALSGTCTFAANTWLTISSQASTCTTTQPNVRNVVAIAKPL